MKTQMVRGRGGGSAQAQQFAAPQSQQCMTCGETRCSVCGGCTMPAVGDAVQLCRSYLCGGHDDVVVRPPLPFTGTNLFYLKR